VFFQLRADPPRTSWRSVKMTVEIKSTQDLWRVCLKSKWARIEIPGAVRVELGPGGWEGWTLAGVPGLAVACTMTTSPAHPVCLTTHRATHFKTPELEFEISADGKRHVDSIYNHIASAVYNLGNYVSGSRVVELRRVARLCGGGGLQGACRWRPDSEPPHQPPLTMLLCPALTRQQVNQPGTGLSDDHKNKILDTVLVLNALLDVEAPFTWVVHVSGAERCRCC
jgi:hypothetical protein